jgi:DNA-binding transcriptional MerR regulator
MLKTESIAAPAAPPAAADHALRVVEAAPHEPTISAVEMTRLTGVGRERLRTWERRHGFPEPVRGENGVRRYRAADVRPIVTVARLVERGVSLVTAIERAQADDVDTTELRDAFGPGLEHASAPVIAITGPSPLVVAWANAETAKAAEAPRCGDVLTDAVPHLGALAVSQLQRLMAAPEGGCTIIEHADWLSSFPTPRRSIAWRVSAEASSEPMVILAQLPEEPRRAAPAITGDAGVWSAAVGAAAAVLGERAGLTSIQRALAEFAKHTGALDAFMAIDHAGCLRAATSIRGTAGARDLPLRFADPALAAVAAGEVDWLPLDACRALGAVPRSAVLAVPLMGGGMLVGAVFLTFPEELALGDVARQQLAALGLILTLALQRERLAQRAAQGPEALAA